MTKRKNYWETQKLAGQKMFGWRKQPDRSSKTRVWNRKHPLRQCRLAIHSRWRVLGGTKSMNPLPLCPNPTQGLPEPPSTLRRSAKTESVMTIDWNEEEVRNGEGGDEEEVQMGRERRSVWLTSTSDSLYHIPASGSLTSENWISLYVLKLIGD